MEQRKGSAKVADSSTLPAAGRKKVNTARPGTERGNGVTSTRKSVTESPTSMSMMPGPRSSMKAPPLNVHAGRRSSGEAELAVQWRSVARRPVVAPRSRRSERGVHKEEAVTSSHADYVGERSRGFSVTALPLHTEKTVKMERGSSAVAPAESDQTRRRDHSNAERAAQQRSTPGQMAGTQLTPMGRGGEDPVTAAAAIHGASVTAAETLKKYEGAAVGPVAKRRQTRLEIPSGDLAAVAEVKLAPVTAPAPITSIMRRRQEAETGMDDETQKRRSGGDLVILATCLSAETSTSTPQRATGKVLHSEAPEFIPRSVCSGGDRVQKRQLKLKGSDEQGVIPISAVLQGHIPALTDLQSPLDAGDHATGLRLNNGGKELYEHNIHTGLLMDV
ncbi:uncharacterized protein [Dendrobates tinctorius]|uniref:uncharacterized protein n=1 Tax=Dendrobates tinctorius TaxID=92724 RepID=UPI003CC9975F